MFSLRACTLLLLCWVVADTRVECHFLDLQFELHFTRLPLTCASQNSSKCRLPVAISLLKAQGTYDLEAVMLEDAQAFQVETMRYFREDTVVSLPSYITGSDETPLYVGIKIYEMPAMAQDYFVLDASKALQHPGHKLIMSVETEGVIFRAKLQIGRTRRLAPNSNGCSCIKKECGCCEHLTIPKIHLDDSVCVNVTYIPKPVYGLSFTFSADGVVLYNDTISARNPPPICFGVPYLKEYAGICLRFHNLEASNETFSGCIDLEAELFHVRIVEHELGCFHIPLTDNKNKSIAQTV